MAGRDLECERARREVDLGVELEERLVDGAELFGAEVAVVDRAQDAGLLDGRELADGVEQVGVGEPRRHRDAGRPSGPKRKPPSGGRPSRARRRRGRGRR